MKKCTAVLAAVMLAALAIPAFAATNPFMDVPANHWAYDAVSQLASRGVISGYPDGSYKGAQPATRYEMASVVARALAKIDIEKASKDDVETLKKLIVEFKDELDALGVKLDKLDARAAVIEKDLGGWSLAGELRFDAKSTGGDHLDGDSWYADEYTMSGRNEFDLDRYRIYLRKRIDDNTSFTARIGNGTLSNSGNQVMAFEHYYVTAKLPYDITFTIGRNDTDWEADLGLYHDSEEGPWVGDWRMNLLDFQKSWGIVDAELLIARTDESDNAWADAVAGDFLDEDGNPVSGKESYTFGLKLNANFNERFRAGLLGYWWYNDTAFGSRIPNAPTGTRYEHDDYDTKIWGIYAGFKFTPDIELKGVYYNESNGDAVVTYNSGGIQQNGESAKAWKAILDIKQEALKFTSLWIEYGNRDNNFAVGENPAFRDYAYASFGPNIFANTPNNDHTSKILFIRADQQWNDKWRTFLRYNHVNFDTDYLDNAVNWSFGVGYRCSPAIEFELAYDRIDYGDNNGPDFRNGGDHVIRFRTYVTF
ncbi:S-layer protein [Synergistales bacterium]|nr:S-layer protein [Synergistales bacterium]